MTDVPPPKLDPPHARLRAAPRPVTRLSRRALVLLAAVTSALVIGATWYALGVRPPRMNAGPELYDTGVKPGADALNGLPRSYADLAKPPKPVLPTAPQVGPPLPGDLGRPMLGAAAGASGGPDTGDRQRHDQAALSDIMFTVGSKPAALAAVAGPGVAPGSQGGETGAPAALDADTAQNLQDRKAAFLKGAVDKQVYSPQRLQHPASPYQLMAGTTISAALVTGLNSDLPGQIVAQVTENVYDSVTGRFLLVPQGTRLIGKYDSVVAYGQERVLLVWTRMIRPDGSSIVLDNLPGTDAEGYAGVEDGVDYHTWRLLKGIALSTLLGISSELAANDAVQGSGGGNVTVAVRQSADNSANQVGQRIVGKDLAVQPTLTVRPGFPVRVLVNRDIVVEPYGG
jgi:type IV secretory pathway VirB10-like protein